jgi:hypothetical protein
MTRKEITIVSEALNQMPFLGAYSPAGYVCPFCREAWQKNGHQKSCELIQAIKIISEIEVSEE